MTKNNNITLNIVRLKQPIKYTKHMYIQLKYEIHQLWRLVKIGPTRISAGCGSTTLLHR
jgi:hypothetical protein